VKKQKDLQTKTLVKVDNPDDLESVVSPRTQGDPDSLVVQDNPDDTTKDMLSNSSESRYT
jgi:hypothetical protein